MIVTPADATRAAISADRRSVISSALPRSDSWLASLRVVGVTGRDVPDRGLGLGRHELDELVHRVESQRRVVDLPDDHGRDLDRVAVGVVDLGQRRFVVADPGRHPAALRERVDPAQAGFPDRAGVPAEQLDHTGFTGDDLEEAALRQDAREQQEHADDDQGHGPGAAGRLGQDQQPDRDQLGNDTEDEDRQARDGMSGPFGEPAGRRLLAGALGDRCSRAAQFRAVCFRVRRWCAVCGHLGPLHSGVDYVSLA